MQHARSDYNRIQDPLDKIPYDEPVFLLRAQDRHAAMAVKHYAELIENDPDVSHEMVDLVKGWVEKMHSWGVKKAPDLERK